MLDDSSQLSSGKIVAPCVHSVRNGKTLKLSDSIIWFVFEEYERIVSKTMFNTMYTRLLENYSNPPRRCITVESDLLLNAEDVQNRSIYQSWTASSHAGDQCHIAYLSKSSVNGKLVLLKLPM